MSKEKIVRCLVLGGAGFIGTDLVEGLLDEGYAVRVFDRKQSPVLATLLSKGDIECIHGDFGDKELLSNAIQGCDIAFHLIGNTLPKTSNDDPLADIESNLVGTVQFLELARYSGLKRIIFMSSGGTVYGESTQLPIGEDHPVNPITSYGIVKLAIEKYLELYRHLYGLEYVVLRASNVYGERQMATATQGAVAAFMQQARNGEPIEIWGDGSAVRDYVHVSDVVDALIRSARYTGRSAILNIGSGHGTRIDELVDIIEVVTGKTVVRNPGRERAFDVKSNILTCDRAYVALGWLSKVGLREGIGKIHGSFKT
ncbi:NAD-dependent epimerase/dehydratase family protein [Collimonas fungivorans]|uniref:NAD-dependent epimerase/dehydratase family protein n=1 Tax=Collimonas fungivorans TaxID=158899 RepID=UPI00067F9D03|nr:NAD-dependent epimerase/dehydratase family protein [Collimonas fungivorans]